MKMQTKYFLILALVWIGGTAEVLAQAAGTFLWSYKMGVPIYGSPAVAQNGTIYITIESFLVALTNEGSNKWTFALGSANHGGYSSPAVAADGTVYVSSGRLYAAKADGSQKWAFPSDSERGSPAISCSNTVYIHGSFLEALSPAGDLIWSNAIGGSYRFGSPALASDGSIYAPAPEDHILHAIAPSGAETWEVGFQYGPGDSPAIGADGTVYVTEDGLAAISPAGATLWVNTTNLFRDSSPAVGKDGTIYVASWGAGSLYAIAPSGIMKWRANLAGDDYTNVPTAATPAIDEAGTIYYPAFNTLYALSPAGSILWTFSPHDGASSQTSPAIGLDGTIYVTFGSNLYALYNTNKLADAPWPMFRQNARHTGKIEKPLLKQPRKRSDGGFEFQLYPQQLGLAYTIECSSNLDKWTALTSFVATNVPMDVVDVTAGSADARFYRAHSPP